MTETSAQKSATEVLTELGAQARSLQARATFVVAQQTREPDLFRLPLTEDLAQGFLATDVQQAARYADNTPMEYMAGRSAADGHIFWTPTDSVKFLSGIGSPENDSGRVVPVFDLSSLASRNLKMTITTTAPESEPSKVVTLYRITRNTARLAQSRRLAAVFRDGAFDKLDEEVVLFNQEVDAISVDGYIFFQKKGLFERSFGFVELLKKQAAETFDAVIGSLEIAGSEELRQAATTDINMMAKMASIRRKLDQHPGYKQAVTMAKLLTFVDEHPNVEVETSGTGDDRTFVFKPAPSSRYKILKLLDDDFLKSDLTALDYLVDSKGEPMP